jgi:uncharacterized membrane protein YhaH (DUF805 family)
VIKSGVAAAALAIIAAVALLALAIPGYFIAIKRLHDRNKSGHWLWLFCLAPGVLNLLGKLAVAQGAALVGIVSAIVDAPMRSRKLNKSDPVAHTTPST